VAYTPDWEPLADALKRVIATGASEDEAKLDLCGAVADQKIRVRVRIAASDYKRSQVFSGGNVEVPPHLAPGDFDWVLSHPFAQWRIGPKPGQHYAWIEGWKHRPLDLIELSTADVIEILCSNRSATVRRETSTIELSCSDAGERKRGRRPRKLEKAKQAMCDDIRSGRQTVDGLNQMLEKQLAGRYDVSRDTARKARTAAVSEFVENSKTTNDK
jgi:hypothetical protein